MKTPESLHHFVNALIYLYSISSFLILSPIILFLMNLSKTTYFLTERSINGGDHFYLRRAISI